MIKLNHRNIQVKIKEQGAELCSLFNGNTGIEHIWQADPTIWERHAPVLFPIVGQVEDGEYFVDGKSYELSQHGFARDEEFKVLNTTETSVTFSLLYSDQSLKKYPYKFELQISYHLSDDGLKVAYKVINKDSKTIFFQIGAHPGFTCPFTTEDSFNDYKIVFDKNLTEDRLLFKDGLLSGQIESNFLTNENTISLNSETFNNDAIILETDKVKTVSIVNKSGNELKVDVSGWPLLGIWSKPKANAPFVCLEPWYGVASVKGQSKELKKKKAIQSLETDESFMASFQISCQ